MPCKPDAIIAAGTIAMNGVAADSAQPTDSSAEKIFRIYTKCILEDTSLIRDTINARQPRSGKIST